MSYRHHYSQVEFLVNLVDNSGNHQAEVDRNQHPFDIHF